MPVGKISHSALRRLAPIIGPPFVSTFQARQSAGEGGARPILCLHGIEAHGLRFFGSAAAAP